MSKVFVIGTPISPEKVVAELSFVFKGQKYEWSGVRYTNRERAETLQKVFDRRRPELNMRVLEVPSDILPNEK